MCKYKSLTKPNHWRVMMFIDSKKDLLDLHDKLVSNNITNIKIKDRYDVSELADELNLHKESVRKYLRELKDLGYVDTCIIKGKVVVLL